MLYVTDIPTVFEVLMLFHWLNLVDTDVELNRLYVRMTFKTVNIVGLVLKRVVTSWTVRLHRVGTNELNKYRLPYMWYKPSTAMHERFISQKRLAPLNQRDILFLSMQRIRSGAAGLYKAPAVCDTQQDHVLPHL